MNLARRLAKWEALAANRPLAVIDPLEGRTFEELRHLPAEELYRLHCKRSCSPAARRSAFAPVRPSSSTG